MMDLPSKKEETLADWIATMELTESETTLQKVVLTVL
jgi:hypothetical protein